MATPVDPTGNHIFTIPNVQPRADRTVRLNDITEEPSSSNGSGRQRAKEKPQKSESTIETKRAKRILLTIKVIFGFILYILVLVCTVFSKLTLVSLTDKLRSATWCNESHQEDDVTSCYSDVHHDTTVIALYWQLLLVIIVPTFIAFLRSLFLGVLGKTTQTYPWPMMRSAIAGVFAAVFEVIAMSAFVFLVLAELPPGISILLLSGVFFCQILIELRYTKKNCWCTYDRSNNGGSSNSGYDDLDSQGKPTSVKVRGMRLKNVMRILKVFEILLENRTMKLFALFLQFISLLLFMVLWCCSFMDEQHTGLKHLYRLRPMIALPLCLFVLSFIWTNKFQDWIAKAHLTPTKDNKTARYKSCFINSSVRLFLYPFVTYIIFHFATSHGTDPWCVNHSCETAFSGTTLSVFLVQLFTTLFAYIFAYVACKMTLSPYGMALPLLLATPLSALCYYLHTNVTAFQSLAFFPSFTAVSVFNHAYPWAPIILFILWIGQVIGIGFYIITKRNIILSQDSEMFLIPYYDGIFFEQQMILNRQTKKHWPDETRKDSSEGSWMYGDTIKRKPRTIFICSTMYRENEVEMRQMLSSINRVASHYEKEKMVKGELCDTYESHIFFDGALNGTQLQEFGLQLLSLLEGTLGVKPNQCTKKKTPYGMCLQYSLNKVEHMKFCIHFKDKNLVKPKKRWSQVMYMNYVIKHRITTDGLIADNTFILTTDADIDFTAKSAVVLLDMLESDTQVAAVCARTHPKGSGPVYWYQIFDYAIGHWFQKPAEHMLGCVLCSPGCFSVFRCSALETVIEEYSTLATSGMEFLMKDMGEDRWLCTLLIKRAWRLEYCAISEDQTYCPLEFGEFFSQRRRWIPSTIANLCMLISEAASITRKNDTVSILFILFQAVMIFSTAISPATVILVIASGLQSAYKFSNSVVLLIISLLVIVSVLYGIICLFASSKTQIDVAKILSFIFAIVMAVVMAGLVKDVIHSIFQDPDRAFLVSPNCSSLLKPNHTEDFDNCHTSSKHIDSLPNTLPKDQFMLPVSTSIIYLGVLAVAYVGAAILHLNEFTCLLHFVWYLLALPSGYLLLLIYSAANLDSQSWGTREGSSGKDQGLLGWGKYFKLAWNKLVLCCVRTRCCKPDHDELGVEARQEKKEPVCKSSPLLVARKVTHFRSQRVEYKQMDRPTKDWLKNLDCGGYQQNFEEHGYTSLHYISAMSLKDFEAIGIDKRGFRLRLRKAAQKLPSLPIHVDVPEDVEKWLCSLEMDEYIQLFKSEGYSTAEDIENLKGLTEDELVSIGVTKRAHLQRLMKALHNLAYPKEVQQNMYHTKGLIENLDVVDLEENEMEFWKDLIFKKLKPTSTQLTSTEEIQQSLRSLRNTILLVMFLINIIWIITLFTVEFPRLADYGINPRAFQLLFLGVYGFIIVVQFVMMICHRAITLVHYFGRITPVQVVAPTPALGGFVDISMSQVRHSSDS